MARRRVERLPVVDDAGLLEDVVSRSDLLNVILRPDEATADEIRRTVFEHLPPAAGGGLRHGRRRHPPRQPPGPGAVLPLPGPPAVEGVVDIRLSFSNLAPPAL